MWKRIHLLKVIGVIINNLNSSKLNKLKHCDQSGSTSENVKSYRLGKWKIGLHVLYRLIMISTVQKKGDLSRTSSQEVKISHLNTKGIENPAISQNGMDSKPIVTNSL